MRVVTRLKAYLRYIRAKQKLKRSGYATWRQYRHNRDPGVNAYADTVKHFYKGYRFVYQCYNADHYAYKCLYNHGPGGVRYGYEEISDWCENNLRFKYRLDIHRCHQQTGLGINSEEDVNWFFNDIGGSDFVFIAFQDERDYLIFMLKWA